MSTPTTPGATSAATPGVSGSDADPAPDEGLRERKKRETRGRLHRVALELVVAHGLDHVTIEQIAGGADVSTRTFFNYYLEQGGGGRRRGSASAAATPGHLVARPADEDVLTSIEAVMRERIAPLVADPGLREQQPRLRRRPDPRPTATGSASGIERACRGRRDVSASIDTWTRARPS